MKKLIVILTLAVIMSGSVLSASAEEVIITEEAVAAEQIGVIAPMSDEIIVKFRVYQGRTQYRHWNQTQGCWVEPNWINYG